VLNLKGSVARHASFGRHQTRRRWDISRVSPSWRQPVQRLQNGKSGRATTTTTWLKSYGVAQLRSSAYHDDIGCTATSHDHQAKLINFYSRPNPPPLRDLLPPTVIHCTASTNLPGELRSLREVTSDSALNLAF
jgi:hypothetical protein